MGNKYPFHHQLGYSRYLNQLILVLIIGSTLAAWSTKKIPVPQVPTFEKEPFTFTWNKIVEYFVLAEEFPIPYLTIKVSALDFILALEVCASYRDAMRKTSHPIFQVQPVSILHLLIK